MTDAVVIELANPAVIVVEKNIGLQGAQGAKGDKGDTGARGADGATGAQGAKGDKGDTGAQGAKGDKGDTGAQGLKGDKGDTGARGADGATGATGPSGAAGASAYELAVANGFSGTQAHWLASLKGADGQDGANGRDGADALLPFLPIPSHIDETGTTYWYYGWASYNNGWLIQRMDTASCQSQSATTGAADFNAAWATRITLGY